MENHVNGIIDNLISAFIWVFLGFLLLQTKSLRARLKANSEKRKSFAADLGMIFALTHPDYDKIVRQDGILLAETVMAMSRRLLSETQFYVLINFITITGLNISHDIYPKDLMRNWACAVGFVPLILNGYFMWGHSRDIQAYESAVLKGLEVRIAEKNKAMKIAQ
jgi:hypothetical protein